MTTSVGNSFFNTAMAWIDANGMWNEVLALLADEALLRELARRGIFTPHKGEWVSRHEEGC